MNIFHLMISWVLKGVIALRYRVKIEGLREVRKALKGKGSILFLPNHPGEMDPIILFTYLQPIFKPHSLAVEHFYHLPGVSFFMNLARAIPVPNFETTVNKWKLKKINEAGEKVIQMMKEGENFLVYPSGHLKRQGHEMVGGSSFAHRIATECPNVNIVLIRTTGLWGSRFSRALTGELPDFWNLLGWGIKTVLKNFIFFTPKRDITVHMELAPADFPKKASRREFNNYLETWYNQYEGEATTEPLKLVSFSPWKEVLPEVLTHEKTDREKQDFHLPQSDKDQICLKLSEISGIPIDKINEDSELSHDLGLDSLDVANVGAFLSEIYSAPPFPPSELKSVYDLYEVAAGVKESDKPPPSEDVKGWPKEEARPGVMAPKSETFQDVFLEVCKRMGKSIACGDANSGYLTYERLRLGVFVLAEKIKALPGDYIGILLPSSVGAYLTFLAVLFARKTPVMLNWTTGVRTLNFSAEFLNIETVLSSRKFLDRMADLDLGVLEDHMVLLEDLKKEIGLGDKLKGMFKSKTTRSFNGVNKDDPAVILFTSGTETHPKAVPLSHENILSGHRSTHEAIELRKDDILLGALPPFHSFGLVVTGLLPLFSGLPVFYAPDPTNAGAMASDIERVGVTLTALAPSFFRNLFASCEKEQLKSMRLFVTGAEKAPPELFTYVESLGSIMLEGYGITECSPIVTLCRMGKPCVGVGEALPHVELCTINPETDELLPDGESGEVCIHGPNVFNGYLGDDVPDPFIELNGKKWYRSGDFARIDEEGNLIFQGRLKRFVKIGGEMISLTALESELNTIAREKRWCAPDADGPQLALSVRERESDRPLLILYATFTLTKEVANEAIRDAGFGKIVKITDVKYLREIPLTGTGKIHYRKLDEMA